MALEGAAPIPQQGQPDKLCITAAMSSVISTVPLALVSVAAQALTAASSSAMRTAVISSSIDTAPLPLQSPAQVGCVGVAVAVGGAGGVAVGVALAVAVGTGSRPTARLTSTASST